MSTHAVHAGPAGPARSEVRSLALAQVLAVACAAAATGVYARLLEAPDFAAWATALALAKGAAMLLDGGLKAALIRHEHEAGPALLATLRRGLSIVALLAVAGLAAVVAWRWRLGLTPASTASLLVLYPAAYLLTYPSLVGPLTRLERAQRFGVVGRSEGTSLLLEFVLPAALIAAGLPAVPAFAVSVVLARLLRMAWLRGAARGLDASAAATPGTGSGALRAMLLGGLGVQAIAALAMLRDLPHLWMVAPWFGDAWAGQYTLAMTACALATQAAAQTMARTAIPRLRLCDPAGRWPLILAQSRRLTIWTLPPLALLPAWMAVANTAFWDQRWNDALALLPWLCLRMVAGVATTTLGAWLMVARAPWPAARVHLAWTACELLAAAWACRWLGPAGLAVAHAATGWVGVALFLRHSDPQGPLAPRLRALCGVLLARPSLHLAVLLALAVHWQPGWLLPCTALLPLAWLAESARWRTWLQPVAEAQADGQPREVLP